MPEEPDNPVDKSGDDGELLAAMLLATYRRFTFRPDDSTRPLLQSKPTR